MTNVVDVVCIRCGTAAARVRIGGGCPICAERGLDSNLTTVYDFERARAELEPALDSELRGCDRYASLLPVGREDLVSHDVGPSPLIDAPRLARAVGVGRLWIKDESRGPTWSFKDRASSIAAAHARVLGREAIIAASTGNAAAATAAHAHRAGLPAVILFARNVNPLMAAFVRSYGAHVFLTASKEDRWSLMRECVERLEWYPSSNHENPPIGNNPWAIDGYKPIAYEVWEQLGRRLPAAVYLPVCYGDALYGVWKGFSELEGMGLAGAPPPISGGEIYGSLERALSEGSETVRRAEVDHPTAAFSISAPQSTYQALHAVRASAGMVSALAETELAEAQRLIVESEGLLVETASAAALAALRRHVDEGRVGGDDEIVVVNSSSGVKSVAGADIDDELPVVESFDALVAGFREVYAR